MDNKVLEKAVAIISKYDAILDELQERVNILEECIGEQAGVKEAEAEVKEAILWLEVK